MTYEIKLIKSDEFKTSEWSGGTTTQIAIYPEDAVYSERNFIWRISSAKVEVEESTFTHLPGINRIIMILDGKLELVHENHHKCVLKPFEQDSFSGSWNTKSYGKVVDFNLMMNENANGNLESLFIKEGEERKFALNVDMKRYSKNTQVIYCASGQAKLYIPLTDDTLILHEKEATIFTIDNTGSMEFTIYNDCEDIAKLVKTNIMY
ncbi:MAG: HutD family protein [Sporanaerobacter sp.]|uniref:HutD/Ves family protein n=1 Tax=Sporanaerobacter sp. TaxID=2010183 RepID=UPI003A0FC00B